MDDLTAVREHFTGPPPPADVVRDGRERLATAIGGPAGPAARSRRLRGHRLGRSLAATAAVAAAAVTAVAVTLNAGSPAAHVKHEPRVSAISAKLLAAMSAAPDDILYTRRTVPGAAAQQTWTWPWSLQPGHQGRTHVLGPGKNVEYIYTLTHRVIDGVPGPGSPGPSIAARGGGIFVDYKTRTWFRVTGNTQPIVLPDAAAALRTEIAHGQWQVTGRATIHGQNALVLRANATPAGGALGRGHATRARARHLRHVTDQLWVNAQTYLPIKLVSARSQTVYQFLAPTTANLAKLIPAIPPGFAKTAPPA